MKKLIKIKKSYDKAMQMVHSKYSSFVLDQRGAGGGEQAPKIFAIFISIVILLVLYAIFKEQLTTFVQTKIFGRMNSIE